MKALFVILLVCLFNLTRANTYYFSAVSGDDSRSSSQAQNSSTPWKTLKKLNSFFSSLRPGDFVLLKRGETFYGSIIANKSGTSSSPITIGAYGTGNRPIITSLLKLTNWVSKSNGIWESYNSSLSAAVNMVLLNGAQQAMGRFPNSSAANKGYLILESHVGTTSITDKELGAATNYWVGAELVVRPRRWVIDRSKITSNTATTISYSPALSGAPYDKMGYFIQNSIKTLDKFGEWYYNPATKKLSVFFGSNSPSSYTVQATSIANLISSNNISNVVFDNLTIKGANENGINIISGSNTTVKNCDILFSGKTGVIANMHDQFKVENSTISNSNNKGLDLGYSSDYAIIRSNKILNTGTIAGMSGNFDNSCIGIYSWGNGNIIEYNEIRNSGYDGIYFNGSDVTIKNNLIDSFCLVKDDGAGIYSHAGSVVYKNRKITDNILLNGIGAGPGTNAPGSLPASGIYFDNNASQVVITGNTLANCNRAGIYIHNCFGMTIKSNTLFNNNNQLNMIEDADNVAVRNTIATNNIFFSKLPGQLITSLTSSADDIGLFGKFDSNYYARPIDDRITIFNHYPGSTFNLDLEGWKKEYNKDASSKRTAKQIAPYRLKSLIGSNKVANGAFTSSVSGVHTYSCTVSLSTSGLLDGGYLQVSPSTKPSQVFMDIGGISGGKKYILKYTVKGSVDNNMVVTTFLRQTTSPYATLTPLQTRKVSTARIENEMIFLAPSTQASATLIFQVDQQSKYYLDNIKVYEADAVVTNPDDSIKFVYNATKVNKTLTLNGSYIDTKGNKFSNGITLLPYKSAILIKTSTSTEVATSSPTVTITSPTNNAKYTAPASIGFTATAIDADGTISKVDFYKGTTLIHTENVSPYKWTWNNVPAGNYTITAKATDNSGYTATSSAILIYVAANKAPTVSITSPSNSTKYTAPATINISAAAADADGSISQVEFLQNGKHIYTDYVAPYTCKWSYIPAGNYTLTAKATDNKGSRTTSANVSISVVTSTLARSAISSADTALSTEVASTTLAKDDSTDAVSKENLSNGLATLKVGPNPARNDLNIFTSGLQRDKKLTISVYSTSGVLIKNIQTGNANQAVQMDISSLSKGVYILRVTCGGTILSSKFIKL